MKRAASEVLNRTGKALEIDHAVEGLRKFFPHHRGFKSGQEKVIRALLKGDSAAAIFPTGGGKSLCYQLPGLLLADEGLTLVVSPLLALMKDQVDSLQALGHPVDLLASSLTLDEKIAVQDRIRNRITSVLFVAPEQLNNEKSVALIRSVPLALVAIDEAHCISEWGHAFRPDYLRLARLCKEFGVSRVVALTATATLNVQEDVCRAFGIRPENCVRTPFFRSNLHFAFTPVTLTERDARLVQALQSQPSGATIVYATRQKTTEDVAAMLRTAKIDARAYHAGMNNDVRKATQEWFMEPSSNARVVVATIAFGMGIDKQDIRYVYHYNSPKSLEGYAQEVGRAGRDGNVSHCQLFCCPEDIPLLEAFAYCGSPSRQDIQNILKEVFLRPTGTPYRGGTERALSHYEMARAHDVTETTIRMLLAFVDIYHGLLVQGTPRYCVYTVKPKDGSPPSMVRMLLLRSSDPTAASALVARCDVKTKWAHIDVGAAAQCSGVSRDAMVRVLSELEQKGILEIKPSKVQHVYRIQKTPENVNQVAETEFERFKDREQQELARVGQVLAFVTSDDCHAKVLTEYFEGKQKADASPFPCGNCQHCMSGRAVRLPERGGFKMDSSLWKLLEHNTQLPKDNPRLLTRFALGFTSPRITKLRLSRHEHFGLFAGAAYQDVLDAITERFFPELRESHY